MDKHLKRIKKTKSGCWEYQGYIKTIGYGEIFQDGLKLAAHRYFYEALIGKIPKGLVIDHLCQNRKCVNPKHLEPVTSVENIKRGWAIRRPDMTKCKHGHPLSGKNLYLIVGKQYTWRACKRCKYIANKKWRKKIGNIVNS